MKRIFVGGGRDYHGPDASMQKKIIQYIGEHLSGVEIVTGGTIGLPNDLASIYKGPVLDVISTSKELEQKYYEKIQPTANRKQYCIGKNYKERRLGIQKVDNIKVVLALPGGQYSTHELLLFQERCIPIVALYSEGSCTASKLPYKGQAWYPTPLDTVVKIKKHNSVEDVAKTIIDNLLLNSS